MPYGELALPSPEPLDSTLPFYKVPQLGPLPVETPPPSAPHSTVVQQLYQAALASLLFRRPASAAKPLAGFGCPQQINAVAHLRQVLLAPALVPLLPPAVNSSEERLARERLLERLTADLAPVIDQARMRRSLPATDFGMTCPEHTHCWRLPILSTPDASGAWNAACCPAQSHASAGAERDSRGGVSPRGRCGRFAARGRDGCR